MELFSSPLPGYIVASIGFENKSAAYDAIRKYWYGINCTAFYCKKDGLWYILERICQ